MTIRSMWKKLGDVLFGEAIVITPVNGNGKTLTREEFERRHEQQEWRRRQLRAEVWPWLEQEN